ncbi:hypothetical protein [Methylobacterium dankookense]|uniref:Uncharacterized protein n=1 Tax=Methylobacterium dankookense TaxID=560405 RepID=A0A564G0A5_9HYPH|nr:hypothetical protein [Methylobacterium dankookense]GJD59081.1 hypothetical protein IFDJLNFL_5008 [Methylobacterium dankookense]VUF13061.1 hypothetical protein MTDSW087_02759 [Methylobacterium dankookense]
MIAQRLIHASPNGDRWSLARDPDTVHGTVHILHEPAPASGGRPERIGLASFLAGNPDAPERRALVDLVGTLVEAAPVTGAAPEAGAAAAEPSPGEEAV